MKRSLLLALVVATSALGIGVPSASAYELAQDKVVSAVPSSFTPNVMDGRVNSLAQVGQLIVVGGTFTQIQASGSGTTLSRNYIFAFDKDTGAISNTFQPQVDGNVFSVAAGPNGTVYVGGQFNKVNGTATVKLAQLNVSDGSKVSTFKPKSINAVVQDVNYTAGRLFIGGQFTKVGADARGMLAELNPTTGAVSADLNLPVTGTHFGGDAQIWHLDVSPDGSRLALIGNFTAVAGQDRAEIAMIDLSTHPATVANWETDLMKIQCYSSFAYSVRDVEFSPDGSYFVLGTTGGYGPGSPSLCDSISRWETNATGTALHPTWVDYTGGDSTYTVTPTGSAIYYGGHERWINNPSAADAAGPGAIEREGIGALDPANGLPLNWDPTRARGQGVFAMLATTNGLFVGSDTDVIGHQTRRKLAFFPLGTGHIVPQPIAPTLPVKAYSLGAQGGSNVMYRVDAGGPAVAALDGGPDWAADSTDNPSQYHNAGSNTADYDPIQQVSASVPSSTPWAIFDHERWSPSDNPPMDWDFPAPIGTNVEVRLYFANRYSGTSQPGKRVFNVSIDGQTVLNHYDIAADVGDQRGVMKAFDLKVQADANIDITFTHLVENPLINGIEIINEDAPPPPPSGGATSRYFDGSTAGPLHDVDSSGIDWSNVRGAVQLDGRLYTAWSDGIFRSQSFDGQSFGTMSNVNLYGLSQFSSDVAAMTGMFYENGRLYFTKAGSSTLYMRYFSTDLPVIGAGNRDLQAFQVTGGVNGVDWSRVQGMFLAGDELYWTDRLDGTLHRIDWRAGLPVAGTGVVVSGPGIDGVDWRAHALFAMATMPPQPPTARIKTPVDCTQLTCHLDGAGSSDSDGTISSYAWDFGDATQGAGVSATHTFPAPGTYTVQLEVTDDSGMTGTTSVPVTVAQVGTISYVDTAADSQTGSTKAHSVVIPGDVRAGDTMLLEFSANSGTASLTAPAGWAPEATGASSAAEMAVYSKVATASDAGSTVTLQSSVVVRGDLTVTAYRGADQADPVDSATIVAETKSTAAHTTPLAATSRPGALAVSMWTDKTAATTTWTQPAGEQVRYLFAQTGAGHISVLITDSGTQVAGGSTVGGLTATADSSTLQALMATIVLNAASA